MEKNHSKSAAFRALFEPDKVEVKFKDRYEVRLRKRRLADISGQGLTSKTSKTILSRIKDGAWLPMHAIGERKLQHFRENAAKNLGYLPADLANYYVLFLPEGFNSLEIAIELNSLREVEYAKPLGRPLTPPNIPDYENIHTNPSQGYLYGIADHHGIDAIYAWGQASGSGRGVNICDIEYAWNRNHRDLLDHGGVTLLGAEPFDPTGDGISHGTAVLSILGGSRDGIGVTGIAYNAGKLVATLFPGWLNVSGAISLAMSRMQPGDIILIEHQTPGPSANFNPVGWINGSDQPGLVAAEWDKNVYDHIVQAVGNGFIVVEAAGNGGENLDDQKYSRDEKWSSTPDWHDFIRPKNNHKPFLRQNDSGAIIVGMGISNTQERWGDSNYGDRVDLQGWGDSIVSGGYGTIYNQDGQDAFYGYFSGTSGASAIVAGVCASLQGIFKNVIGRPATCQELRQLLVSTGAPQTGDLSKHIGPLPNLRSAIEELAGGLEAPTIWPPHPACFHIPPQLLISVYPQERDLSNPTMWITLDHSDPQEGGAGSILVSLTERFIDNQYVYQGGFPLPSTIGESEVKAASFIGSYRFHRLRSPVASATYCIYDPPAGCVNVTASQGTSDSMVRVSWDAVAGADHYELFKGRDNPDARNDQTRIRGLVTVRETFYEDFEADPTGGDNKYWVRAVYEFDQGAPTRHHIHTSLFSGPAIGYVSIPAIEFKVSQVRSSCPEISWKRPQWVDVIALPLDVKYHIYRAITNDWAQATEIYCAQTTREDCFINGHPMSTPVPPSTEYEDIDTTIQGTRFYWVCATYTGSDEWGESPIETPIGNSQEWPTWLRPA